MKYQGAYFEPPFKITMQQPEGRPFGDNKKFSKKKKNENFEQFHCAEKCKRCQKNGGHFSLIRFCMLRLKKEQLL